MFRAFAKEFLQYAKTHTKPGTHTFYSVCLERLLTFAAIADAPLDAITGEMVSRYARHRQEVPENSVVTVNGDLRTLRRIMHLAVEWGSWTVVPAIHELPQPKGRERVVSFEEEALYLAKASEQSPRCGDSGGRYRGAPEQRTIPAEMGRCGFSGASGIPAWRDSHSRRQDGYRTAKRSPHPACCRSSTAAKEGGRGEGQAIPVCVSGRGQLGTHRFLSASARKGNRRCRAGELSSSTAGVTRSEPGPHSPAWTVSPWPGSWGIARPSVAARYYIHVTETHVAAGFGKFVEYQTRNVAEGMAAAFPQASEAVQWACFCFCGTQGGTQYGHKWL